MVTDGDYTCSDHSMRYREDKSLGYTPETNVTYVNYTLKHSFFCFSYGPNWQAHFIWPVTFYFLSKLHTQHGAWTQDPDIKNPGSDWLGQPGIPGQKPLQINSVLFIHDNYLYKTYKIICIMIIINIIIINMLSYIEKEIRKNHKSQELCYRNFCRLFYIISVLSEFSRVILQWPFSWREQ